MARILEPKKSQPRSRQRCCLHNAVSFHTFQTLQWDLLLRRVHYAETQEKSTLLTSTLLPTQRCVRSYMSKVDSSNLSYLRSRGERRSTDGEHGQLLCCMVQWPSCHRIGYEILSSLDSKQCGLRFDCPGFPFGHKIAMPSEGFDVGDHLGPPWNTNFSRRFK